MKKIIKIMIVIIMGSVFVPINVFAKEYVSQNYGFKFETTDTYYLIDESNIEENRAFIESYGLTAADLVEMFKSEELIVLGVKSDELVTFRIKVWTDSKSEKIWDISKASETELEDNKKTIQEEITNDSANIENQEYLNDNRFLKTVIKKSSQFEEIYYHTIQNGKNYEIKFEDYNIDNREISQGEIENIYNSFKFTDPKEKPIGNIIVNSILIAVVVISVFGIAYQKVYLKRKNK